MARWLKRQTQRMFQYAEARIKGWTQPPSSQLITGAVADMAQSKTELIAENALLRQRLIVLQRQTTPPAVTPWDRALLILLASKSECSAFQSVRPKPTRSASGFWAVCRESALTTC
ncbi:MAG: hypothetical protein M5R40_06790 [Anaerolineae bacterium]|nr:hypothetical protein [Anaerolineae bacterium]